MVRGQVGAATLLVVRATAGCSSAEDPCACQYPESPSSSQDEDRDER